MKFVWDETKNRSNLRKHGLSFQTASKVFDDPLHLTRPDPTFDAEERWQTAGMVDGLLIMVIYTVSEGEEEIVRLISARRISRQERTKYEEANEI